MKDELGERMKSNYEDRTRIYLPRRTYTVIRLDGKAFHTFTRGFKRPYDLDLMNMMDQTAIELCESIQGVKMAFVQSDEITLILTDFETIHTDAWFDGNIQKMASISASIATAAFNQKITDLWITRVGEGNHAEVKEKLFSKGTGNIKRAIFDSRVFSISDVNEVVNNLIWRQQDATRNSISMAAQALYSHKELNQKNSSELQEMIFQKGTNWNDYPVGFKRGRMILKEKSEMVEIKFSSSEMVERTRWGVFEPPIFTQDKGYILTRLPRIDGMIVGGLA